MALKIYTLGTCSTCRAATKWLSTHDIAFEELAIRETPPSRAELKLMLRECGGQLRRLFNTSGRDYREQRLGDRLDTVSEEAALELLTLNGNLVKRPFVIGNGVALVGFDEAAWRSAIRK